MRPELGNGLTDQSHTLVSLATRSRVYDLGQPLETSTPVSPSQPSFRMALLVRHGDSVRSDGGSGAIEMMSMTAHTGTHIDALCHVSQDMLLQGGADAYAASKGGRFNVHGVETVAPIIKRGVMLDVPSLFSSASLDGGHAITADELHACSEREHVDIEPGDVVLVRTGWPVGRWQDAVAFSGVATGVPGPDETGARWLADKEVSLVGADTLAFEWLGPGNGHSLMPVHSILLVERGIHIVEVLNLEELARDHVYDFLFIAIPLPIVGATGSPIRPLALVDRD